MLKQTIPTLGTIKEVILIGRMAVYDSHAEIVQRIPEQWREFRLSRQSVDKKGAYYGASPCTDDGKIHYLAGVVFEGGDAPMGDEHLTIQAGEYAVAQVDHAALLRVTWTWLLETWLPGSGRQERRSPEFERYIDISEEGLPIGPVEIWIPLEPIAPGTRSRHTLKDRETMKGRYLSWSAAGILVSSVMALGQAGPAMDRFTGHPRVAIISDIGNEPDDQMSFVRLMLYSNELDLEAMIASTSTWQKGATHPETMRTIIQAYGKVRDHLQLHAEGWPAAEDLDRRVFAGQPTYGMAATGNGKSTAGSTALVHDMERDDPRPLWICVWGGANTLAQALMDLRATRSPQETERLIAKLRISSISDQDDAGPWIRREFPSLFYIVKPSPPNSDEYYYATWTGISGDIFYRNGAGADTSLVTNEWLDKNIRSKGPLGQLYPRFMFIMEGDTPSFLGLLDNGLDAFSRPDWGGWGGRYVYRQPYGESHPIWTQGGDTSARATSQDAVAGLDGREQVSDQATIWRWRASYQNDFAARMDWTIKDYAHANHNPVLTVNGRAGRGPIELNVETGETVTLDAAGSNDPDGQTLHYKWWVYPEAGLTGGHGADVTIAGSDLQRAVVTANSACRPAWIPGTPCTTEGIAHIILEVSDEGSPRLTSYRRIVLHVGAKP